jgi:hypothetical protein
MRSAKCKKDIIIHYSTMMMFYCLERPDLAWPFSVVGKLLLKSSLVTLLQLLVKVTRYF